MVLNNETTFATASEVKEKERGEEKRIVVESETRPANKFSVD